MKHTKVEGRVSQGFTLVEMLVVIAIIAILAALILPALSAGKRQAQITKAKLEMTGLLTAIHDYETDNSVFPVSKDALREAAKAGNGDFTFGTSGVVCNGPGGPHPSADGFSTPGSAQPILATCSYQTNNSEVIAILMDLEKYGNGVQTVNFGHVRNPKRSAYLNGVKFSNDTKSSGVGLDGVYRDPWGNPYIITMDLNSDNKARDVFYGSATVSADPNDNTATPKRGLNGLVPTTDTPPYYEANLPVMVWSAGPDKLIDPNGAATQGVNKDNVLSWKQ